MDIINDFVPTNIIVKLKLPNQRAYEVAWSIALLRGYENFDEFVNDVFLDSIEMFPCFPMDAMTLKISSGDSRLGSRGKKNEQRYLDKRRGDC
jgi:hypothetical protein